MLAGYRLPLVGYRAMLVRNFLIVVHFGSVTGVVRYAALAGTACGWAGTVCAAAYPVQWRTCGSLQQRRWKVAGFTRCIVYSSFCLP